MEYGKMKKARKIIGLLLMIIAYPVALIVSAVQGAFLAAKEFVINAHFEVQSLVKEIFA